MKKHPFGPNTGGSSTAGGNPGVFNPLTTTGLFTQAGEDGITAFATGGQTNATALSATKNLHRISTCATAGDSVKLPAALVGQAHFIRNDGATSAQVFGQATETIDGVASATGVSQPAGSASWYVCTTAGAWTSLANTTREPLGTVTAPSGVYAGDTSGWYRSGSNVRSWATSGVPNLTIGTNTLRGGSGTVWGFAGSNDSTAAFDTAISRVSAGLVGIGTGAAASVAGSLRASTYATSAPVTETNATHAVAATTSHLIANRAGTITVTLPAASSFPGRILWIRTIQAQLVVSDASNVVPQVGGAAGTAILAATDGAWAMLVSDGTNWETMASSSV